MFRMTITEVLIEYDWPRLFIARHCGRKFLFVEYEDEPNLIWAVCRINDKSLTRLKNKEISLQECFKQSKGIYLAFDNCFFLKRIKDATKYLVEEPVYL